MKTELRKQVSAALPIRVSHRDISDVKQFGWFGGMGYVEALAQTFVDGGWACLGRARDGANSYDCGEDCGGTETAWVFQPLLGRNAGQAVAGDRQMGDGISLPERAVRGNRFERHRPGPRPAWRDAHCSL